MCLSSLSAPSPSLISHHSHLLSPVLLCCSLSLPPPLLPLLCFITHSSRLHRWTYKRPPLVLENLILGTIRYRRYLIVGAFREAWTWHSWWTETRPPTGSLSVDTLVITSLRSGGYRPAGKGLSPRTRFKVTPMSRGEGCVKTSSSVMLKHLHCSPVVGCSIEKRKIQRKSSTKCGTFYFL